MGSTAGWWRGGWGGRTALAAFVLVAASSHRAGATLPDGAVGEGQAAEPPSGPAAPPLAVAVRSAWPAVQPEAVRKAVEEELRSWVVLVAPETVLPAYASRLLVDVTPARGVLAVQYEAPGRKPLVRVIPIFGNGEAAVRTIAWLAGNLVRDQASDLLPAPAAPPRAEAGTPPSAAAAAPPPPPPPPPEPDTATAVRSLTFQARPPARRDYALATASLFFPLATNGYEPGIRTHLSANLLYGRIGTLDGGLQLGTANEVTGNVRGFQLGLLFNRAGGDVDGAQVAAVNSARGQVTGTQAGLVNAAGDVQGAQIGLVNVGRNVHGLQLGLVNVSDDIDGVPIGIINVSRTGGIHATIWTSGTTQVAVGLKFSTRHVYTLFSGATQSLNGSRLYGPGLAVGYRIPLRPVVLETDVGGTYLIGGPLTGVSRTDGLKDDMALASWRVLAGLEFHRHLTVFGGAALTTRFRFYQTVGQDLSYELGPDLFAGVQL
jgi:hypothetical protein